jgi:XTP/dITP diphosphohydrolase
VSGSTAPNELVIATRNRYKFEEIRQLLKDTGIKIRSLEEFPEVPEAEENGATYAENAIEKAVAAAKLTGRPSLGDDTGLEVEALDGAPGLYSARFAGEKATFLQNRQKLLSLLDGMAPEKRSALFRCVMALTWPDGTVKVVEGAVSGRITTEDRGTAGFGYDPIFFVTAAGKTFSEMTAEEKNRISHRARALQKIKDLLKGL